MPGGCLPRCGARPLFLRGAGNGAGRLTGLPRVTGRRVQPSCRCRVGFPPLPAAEWSSSCWRATCWSRWRTWGRCGVPGAGIPAVRPARRAFGRAASPAGRPSGEARRPAVGLQLRGRSGALPAR